MPLVTVDNVHWSPMHEWIERHRGEGGCILQGPFLTYKTGNPIYMVVRACPGKPDVEVTFQLDANDQFVRDDKGELKTQE